MLASERLALWRAVHRRAGHRLTAGRWRWAVRRRGTDVDLQRGRRRRLQWPAALRRWRASLSESWRARPARRADRLAETEIVARRVRWPTLLLLLLLLLRRLRVRRLRATVWMGSVGSRGPSVAGCRLLGADLLRTLLLVARTGPLLSSLRRRSHLRHLLSARRRGRPRVATRRASLLARVLLLLLLLRRRRPAFARQVLVLGRLRAKLRRPDALLDAPDQRRLLDLLMLPVIRPGVRRPADGLWRRGDSPVEDVAGGRVARRRALAHGLAAVARLSLVGLAVGVFLGRGRLLVLVVVLLVDDRQVPEHEVRDEDLLVKRPARVGQLDVAQAVDGPLDVDRVAGKVGRSSEGSGRRWSTGRRRPLRLEQRRGREPAVGDVDRRRRLLLLLFAAKEREALLLLLAVGLRAGRRWSAQKSTRGSHTPHWHTFFSFLSSLSFFEKKPFFFFSLLPTLEPALEPKLPALSVRRI